MEMKIVWSKLAQKQLKNIFHFYNTKVSLRIAQKFVTIIIQKISVLENNPYLGTKEKLLSEYPQEYRFLLVGNYKVIYQIQHFTIFISSIFDCRRNPEELKDIGLK
jgi:plasmid stabilization system protein ParE